MSKEKYGVSVRRECYEALKARSLQTGESINHLVDQALEGGLPGHVATVPGQVSIPVSDRIYQRADNAARRRGTSRTAALTRAIDAALAVRP